MLFKFCPQAEHAKPRGTDRFSVILTSAVLIHNVSQYPRITDKQATRLQHFDISRNFQCNRSV